MRIEIREQDTQHNIQQEKTQPNNSNTHEHQEDLYINNISNNRRQQFLRQEFEHLMMTTLVETYSNGLLSE
jgi:hypothetical protein